jgi:hypothetical protein
MDPLATATAFGTVIQLICNFRQERGATKAAELTDFLSWLSYHKFEEIKGVIQNATNLQVEIQELLKREVGEVSAKLDVINESIVAVASRIEGFSGIVTALGVRTARLSNQAIAILQEFEKSNSTELGVFLNLNPPQCALFPEDRGFTVEHCRFLVEDIEALQVFGFIKQAGSNRDGDPLYALTRAGADYARTANAES